MKHEQATAAQRAAIDSNSPELMAVAGPGSGKTATLVSRIQRLVAGGTPHDAIVVLTFTNAAARELQERLGTVKAHVNGDESMPPIDVPPVGFIGTLHSFALRCLREHGHHIGYDRGVSLIDPEAADDLLAETAKQMGCKLSLKQLVELRGAGRPTLKEYEFDVARITVRAFYDEMRAAGVVDYDALLSEFARLLETETGAAAVGASFLHLLVDEVQDSSPLDWKIYRALPIPNKCYVGDPDQAIYGFRGGSVAEMVAAEESPAIEVVKLEENFRSCAEVCAAAQHLIEANRIRVQKVTRSVVGRGGGVELLEPAENAGHEIAVVAERIRSELTAEPDASIAVLARTNWIAAAFRKELPELGIPVVTQKLVALPDDWRTARALVEFLTDPQNDTVAYFYLIARFIADGMKPAAARLAARGLRIGAGAAGVALNQYAPQLRFDRVNEADTVLHVAGTQKISREARAIMADRLADLPNGATAAELSLSLAELRSYEKEDTAGNVRVMTVHASKGREFDVVFLVGLEEEVFPGKRAADDAAAIEEERRVAYVGATRARRALYLSFARTRPTAWKSIEAHRASRFVDELLIDNL